jgi:hypothetical protein
MGAFHHGHFGHHFAFRHPFFFRHRHFAFRHFHFRHGFAVAGAPFFVGSSCYVVRHVWTPWGWQWRSVWACY